MLGFILIICGNNNPTKKKLQSIGLIISFIALVTNTMFISYIIGLSDENESTTHSDLDGLDEFCFVVSFIVIFFFISQILIILSILTIFQYTEKPIFIKN